MDRNILTDATTDPIDRLRSALIGHGRMIPTPVGEQSLLYADYTASGRGLATVERQIDRLMADYANPHSIDSLTGRRAGQWLHEARARIKSAINASEDDALILYGAGATAGIHKLQEILGLTLPPATAQRVSLAPADRPVVFVGPYEHHSNELSWRESLAEVVSIPLDKSGGIDMAALERALSDKAYRTRQKIGAFSAASNVTGVETDVPALARLLHRHDAILCLDCAASAPYRQIDMHPAQDPMAAIDAVYFSPHKFIGGPGACGVLALNKALYRQDLPPTQSAGGTVRYVWKDGHDFIEDIDAREQAGTPGLPQIVRAALALQLQAEIGFAAIETRERSYLRRAFSAWQDNPNIEILGPAAPERRLGIVAFNILDSAGQRLSPRLVTALLNDFYGIQTRAGCSCAGPYGHDLLQISAEETAAIRKRVLAGETGARPGWCRLSLHWLMDDEEVSRIISAVEHIACEAETMAEDYRCDAVEGSWTHRRQRSDGAVMPDRLL
ncbi:aminotransferase class V-fold PLP-dependent enzyme [Maricaulis sp.]|uniref:aminotransferase class V-fold PLP-dependent enzyme n=1 Tax=Maricaulis sp. TaxID=1486257 RepID=UPI00262434CE|nr:aminotransferase class V-fold PLP-dependent enzyme [Maricaulis sp.]